MVTTGAGIGATTGAGTGATTGTGIAAMTVTGATTATTAADLATAQRARPPLLPLLNKQATLWSGSFTAAG